MKKEEIFEYVKKQYGTMPEYLWAQSLDNAVLRHKICLNEISFFTDIFKCVVNCHFITSFIIFSKSRLEVCSRSLMKTRDFCSFAFSDYFPKDFKRIRFINLDWMILFIQ